MQAPNLKPNQNSIFGNNKIQDLKSKVLVGEKMFENPVTSSTLVEKVEDINHISGDTFLTENANQFNQGINKKRGKKPKSEKLKVYKSKKLSFGKTTGILEKASNFLFGNVRRLSYFTGIIGILAATLGIYPISQVFAGNWKLKQQIEIFTIEKLSIGSPDWYIKDLFGAGNNFQFYWEISGFIFSIRFYAICIFLGLLVGYILALFLAKKQHIATTVIDRLVIGLIVFGLIGARLFFVAFNWSIYKDNPANIILGIPQGGLALFGGLVGGFVYLWMYSTRFRFNLWEFLDVIAPSILIGQVIGRFGNMFNYEAFGPATSVYWKMFVPSSVNFSENLSDRFFHPTFIYEIIPNFILFFLILYFWEKLTRKRSGLVFGVYGIGYGIIRFFTEFYRLDALKINLVFPFKIWIWDFNYFYISQFSAIILVFLGIWVYLTRKKVMFLKKSLEEFSIK